jgi:hypothetical protein
MIRLASRCDSATVSLDNTTANRQANTGTFICISSMKTLKHSKNPIQVFLVEANAVVFDSEFQDVRTCQRPGRFLCVE